MCKCEHTCRRQYFNTPFAVCFYWCFWIVLVRLALFLTQITQIYAQNAYKMLYSFCNLSCQKKLTVRQKKAPWKFEWMVRILHYKHQHTQEKQGELSRFTKTLLNFNWFTIQWAFAQCKHNTFRKTRYFNSIELHLKRSQTTKSFGKIQLI